ncbi:Uma2 family endonuclease [Hassallia byssoidea VB512170]|uniref:Uma2 family endonuclease n=1 Tax=Hassallia byssoidea VB512170 TaxID=1304833 RepID=A0A846H123_9CYAN|nr:Uma2 family endonuclease [Hassalia byssoidea]NEU71048.1 Uma2 family endonuclease [Hassalia byssoidea VB512170]
MTTTKQIVTFEQYLTYNDGTDTRYELERGELIPMSQPRGGHGEIMHFLERSFTTEIERLKLDWVARQAAVGVRVPQVGRRDTSRVPDVTVLLLSQWKNLRNREAVIELNEEPPLLIVEVVSAGTESRDHRAKRAEYNILGIPVYLLVDFLDFDQNGKAVDKRVTVLTLVEGFYDEAVYRGEEVIQIPTFSELKLTANQLINAGR